MKSTSWNKVTVVAVGILVAAVAAWAAPNGGPPEDVIRAAGGAPAAANEARAKPDGSPARDTTATTQPASSDDAIKVKRAQAQARYDNVAQDFEESLKVWEARMAETLDRLEKLQVEVKAGNPAAASKGGSAGGETPATQPAAVSGAQVPEESPSRDAEVKTETVTVTRGAPEHSTGSNAAGAAPRPDLADRCERIARDLESLADVVRAIPGRVP
jgi:hypothetical protein